MFIPDLGSLTREKQTIQENTRSAVRINLKTDTFQGFDNQQKISFLPEELFSNLNILDDVIPGEL